MTEPVGIGVFGANSFVANAAVLPAIEASGNARLVATASRSDSVQERWASTDVGSYEAVLEHPDVEAVYIPLPNGLHREWTEKAAAAGRHVLCEKPLASDTETAQAMADACDRAGVLLAEAWMTPFARRYRAVLSSASSGEIGDLETIESQFTFTIGPGNEANYRWDPDQGGGALLDVGIYCLGPIVDRFGSSPASVTAVRRMTERGVDARTSATLTWADGRTASIDCSFVDAEAQTLRVVGSAGVITVGAEAYTGGSDARSFEIDVPGRSPQSIDVDANDPYQSMIEAFADAVRGEAEWARPVERSIEMLALIDRIEEAARD